MNKIFLAYISGMDKTNKLKNDLIIQQIRRGQTPEYFKKLPGFTDIQIWEQLNKQYEMSCHYIMGLQVQTRDEAISGISNNENFIGYLNDELVDELNWKLNKAKQLAQKLEPQFKSKKLSPDFMFSWGIFCEQCGAIMSLHNLIVENIAVLKGANNSKKKTNKDKHRLWYAHTFLTLKAERPKATRVFLDEETKVHILDLLDKNFMAEEGFGRDWFIQFLVDYHDNQKHFNKSNDPDEYRPNYHYLTAAFGDKKLSIKEMERLAEKHPVIIPITNLKSTLTSGGDL